MCGSPSRKLVEHHPTGRDATGEYFDADMTARLCLPCHARIHREWVFAGLDRVDLATESSAREHREMNWAYTVLIFGQPSPSTALLAWLVLAVGIRVIAGWRATSGGSDVPGTSSGSSMSGAPSRLDAPSMSSQPGRSGATS